MSDAPMQDPNDSSTPLDEASLEAIAGGNLSISNATSTSLNTTKTTTTVKSMEGSTTTTTPTPTSPTSSSTPKSGSFNPVGVTFP